MPRVTKNTRKKLENGSFFAKILPKGNKCHFPQVKGQNTIVQLADGRWEAFEFKVSEDKAAKGAESLSRLRAKLCSNARAQTREPEFMDVITGNGEYARKAEDGIYVIPPTSADLVRGSRASPAGACLAALLPAPSSSFLVYFLR